MKCALAICLLALLLVQPAEGAFLDAVLAEVDGTVITASDINLARALSLFGFRPSRETVRAHEIESFIDALLVVGEARDLGIQGNREEIEDTWREISAGVGGQNAFEDWMERNRIEPNWARRMVEADLRWKKFIDLRFRAFAFVTEEDLTQAIGEGPHDRQVLQQARDRLRSQQVERRLALWLEEARDRATIRRTPQAFQPIPIPFPMPPAERK